MQQGSRAMASGDFATAVNSYSMVTQSLPAFAEGHLNLGLALFQSGQLDKARPEIAKSLSLKPSLRGANLFLGLIAYRQNHFKDAETYLKRETTIDPRNSKAWMWLGVCRLAESDAHGAIEPLDEAFALDPKDPDTLYHRGHAYLLVANASYDAMFRLDGDSVRVHQVLAEAYAQSYRNQDAVSEFEIAVKMAPHQPGLHEELGDQYWVVGNLEKATAAYRDELGNDPYSATAMYKLGSLLVRNQGAEEGVQFLRKAIQADPSLNDAHYYLGDGLIELGKEQEAAREFQLAIAVDPTADRAMSSYYKLAQVYRRLHDDRQAETAMQSFLELRAVSRARLNSRATKLVHNRSELPVADPEQVAIAGGGTD
jgi:tetratricopeptide (TPR) repeat protein